MAMMCIVCLSRDKMNDACMVSIVSNIFSSTIEYVSTFRTVTLPLSRELSVKIGGHFLFWWVVDLK